jgi:hypothetical protein
MGRMLIQEHYNVPATPQSADLRKQFLKVELIKRGRYIRQPTSTEDIDNSGKNLFVVTTDDGYPGRLTNGCPDAT